MKQLAREVEKANKRAVAEQKRQEREARRLEIQRTKSNKQLYLVKRQEETDRLNSDLAEDVARLGNLLDERQQRFAGFSLLMQREEPGPFVIPPELRKASPEPIWENFEARIVPLKIGFFERLFFGPLGRHRRAETHLVGQTAEYRTQFKDHLELWRLAESNRVANLDKARAVHEEQRAAAMAEVAAYNAEVDELEAAYEKGEVDGVLAYNELLLQQSDYPDGFPQGAEIDFRSDLKELKIDYHMPNLDIVPEVAAYRYVKTRDEIESKPRKEKDRKKIYSSIIFSVALRTFAEVFDSDKSQKIDSVEFNGYVEGLDPATGQDVRVSVISVQMTKEQYGSFDLARLEPAACLQKLGAVISFPPEAMESVTPPVAKASDDATFLFPPLPLPTSKSITDLESIHWVSDKSPAISQHPIPRPPAGFGSGKWVPADTPIEVRGFVIPGGMLYHGNSLKAPSGQVEPALIDPRLPVAPEAVDETVRLMDYWPSYHAITPQARRAYLQWLSAGRTNPGTNIGYIFLFFYGLERRVLVDLNDSTDPEIGVIGREVERLLDIYSHNNSFRSYASSFLSLIQILQSGEPEPESDPPVISHTGYELPLQLRVALGQRAKGEIPIDANWARTWALADPNLRKRTPVTRCEAPFKALFADKFNNRFPSGMPLPKIKTRLRTEYHAASSGLRGVKAGLSSDLPDVTASSKPGKIFQPLLDQCAEELDAFSRYLGRNPGQEESLDAILQLPSSLWPVAARSQLDELRDAVIQNNLTLSFGELSGKFNAAGALNKDKTLGFARALSERKVGMEPDVLSGAKIPKCEDKVVLFCAAECEGSVRSSPEYQAAAITIGLAYNVAMADGAFSAEEEAVLKHRVDNWPGLSVAHRKRLHAHLQLQAYQSTNLATYKKRLEPLDAGAREAVAKFLAHLAQADGTVSTKEVKVLEKIYSVLGLDKQQVFTDLHRAPSGQATPSVPASATKPDSFSLDLSKIADLQKETAHVSSLLAQVFIDEDSAPAEPEPACETSLIGLDEDHSSFLRLLFSRASWSREEIEEAAADLGLMIDGALDCINEAGMEHFEELVIEDGEPLEINQEVVERILVG